MTLWIILGIVIVIILVVGLYNNLVQLKMRVKNAWAQIDTQLKRRFDLIPNLVETVKGYMVHENTTLENITKARNSYSSANTISEKSEANNNLSNTLKTLFAVAEAYPELKANENFKALQEELTTTENKIAYARQFYNDTVQMYNTAILSFPQNLFANAFGFKEEGFFEVNESEKEPVKVQF